MINSNLKKLLISGSFLSVIGIGSGLLGYVYQILMGRLISPPEFALFTAIMAFSALIGSPMGGISLAVARHIARLNARSHFYEVGLFCVNVCKKSLWASIAIAITLLLLTDTLQSYLKSPNKMPIFLLVLVLVLAILSSINLGILQGSQRFKWIGLINLAGVIVKILFSVLFIYFGLGIIGALLGVIAGSFVCWMLGRQLIKPMSTTPTHKGYLSNEPLIENTFKTTVPMVVAGIAFSLSTQQI